ncbi:methyltransferase, FkbM family [Tepidimonas sediminis]|uniref:Methyltransferase, FkbM family n=1 Tax=Tepidimonas sediminis TaxID=2588941 RepID=A0A554WGP1_9BURK|nr:FkbM family methyltransferase [Tepidimonas sediminis]TSE22736.1 methyltransferase, FkbM family [Tepidimonas sediminis]
MLDFKILKEKAPRPLKNLIKRGLACLNWDPWLSVSWSQEGEDIVLRRFFGDKKNGFYVDIGAHHPKRFSNTFYFYRRGWSGINIDAMPGSMRLFNKYRPRDLNLELGVAGKQGELDYYVFNEKALNGFFCELSRSRNDADSPYRIEKVVRVRVVPLKDILGQYAKDKKIDFMNVDVEGLDLDVLQSNDWSRFRPKMVLAEVLGKSLVELEKDPLAQFMRRQGYSIFAKQVNTVFFLDDSEPRGT